VAYRQEGYILVIGADGHTIEERDTVLCRHCQRIIEVKPGTWGRVYLVHDPASPTSYRDEPGAYCGKCMGPICHACDDTGTCVPFERALEDFEARMSLMQAIGRR
jgi:hypothetical protein